MSLETGIEIYERRAKDLAKLDLFREEIEKQENSQTSWRRVRAGVLLAPLVSACVLASPRVRETLDFDKAFYVEASVVWLTAMAFASADRARQRAFRNYRSAALEAVPIVAGLDLAIPSWLDKALQADKDINPAEVTL